MMLGDLGHEVIKVEAPGAGDPTRAWGPPWQDGQSAYYQIGRASCRERV